MNTGFLGPAVATVLTVYGIETNLSGYFQSALAQLFELQQYLPFTVLKLRIYGGHMRRIIKCCNSTYRLRY